ncbi:hypothetical protein G3567_10820 [Psychroflexus sp. YR1-1]|uniref:Uncharacterized protein n=1 Tax=Psychroflexus aurantiacus TaxID=2709310 RepID=A0A6B3R1V8_9FLAO|nr:DUF6090 family protein [Psychroflexus aurantiacus]NEV94636.1 hypothetical protein [Psychroflexus aurantiacus]
MIKFFRKIRQNLLSENKFSKYLLYAIGEIILVVIGILIALQINNHNELNKQRAKEIQFLKNIKSDLIFEEKELERHIGIREGIVNSAQIALEHFKGKPVENIQMFNYHAFNVGIWQEFKRNNNTFVELLNSGNFTIISNESIKSGLLNLDIIHNQIISNREHLRNDMEHYFYDPWFKTVDLDPLAESFLFYASKKEFDNNIKLSRQELDRLLNDTIFKNGFVLSVFTNSLIIDDYKKMIELNKQVVELINKEITKG